MQSRDNMLQLLIELRKRLLHSVVMLGILFFIAMYFANDLYATLARPLLRDLPKGQGLIATHITAPLFVPYDLALMVALFAGVPYFLYQAWQFIAPALYRNEKKRIWPILFISTFLFYSGVAFAYFVILPVIFKLLTHAAPIGVNVSPDMTLYLDFALKLFFIFGAIFEVPVITILLIWTGVVTREQLKKFRPYAIVSAFIIGMLLAPPDVLSQTMLAIPLWMLFELGIFLSKFWRK